MSSNIETTRGIRVLHGQSYHSLETIAARVRREFFPTSKACEPLNLLRLFEGLSQYTVIANNRRWNVV